MALADSAVILALGMIIENKNAELLSNFAGRIKDLEEKVKTCDNRLSSLEYELQSIKAQSTNSMFLLLFAFRDLWKECVDSNFQIFSQNCQFHYRRLESLEYFNVLLYIILSTTVLFF